MLICNPYEIVIQGLTQSGKKFRPSDWAERLCGVLSSFDQGHRLSYHQWVRPILVEQIRCVAVDRKLEQINPAMFHFLMDFAHDNDLRIIDCKSLLEEQGQEDQPVSLEAALQQKEQPILPPIEISKNAEIPALQTQIRELLPNEISTAFGVMHVLRPNIRDLAQFQDMVTIQQAEGYRLLGIFEEGKQSAVAVCGFRISTNFASGRYLHIDDLVTSEDSVRKGYASQLLEEIKNIASAEGCGSVHADSRVDPSRNNAHRLYLKHGFMISCHHFSYIPG
ncbi:GNAT family N-acetyltransferase [Snodgrassella sp. CFCC 13594]|uniref:GNAT family N-acetyltransferase n=1 Tax=Snodgrassella sp. CFCC 13594 TaxID=1775559 RepID=UPI00082C3451|nr:GNAT family N-acetyltransferase [Snodgrassella sp. CFCC 13594]